MAIATLDDLIAGAKPPVSIAKNGTTTVAGRWMSTFYYTGYPGAAAAPTPGVNGLPLTSYAGQIPFTNPPGGDNTHLMRLSGNAPAVGTLLLCDRLWHNSGLSVTSTGLQSFASGAMPARDADGLVDGIGIQVGLEVTTVMGAGTPIATLGYTNSSGTASRSGVSATMGTTMAVGNFVPIGLQAGDIGVRSIQGLTLSASMSSGAFSLVAYRVLARLAIAASSCDHAIDAITGGFPRLYDNTVPFFIWIPQGTTAPSFSAQIFYAQG